MSKIASSGLQNLHPTVRNILTQAQHLNARDNITGLLVFNSVFFAQVLEGEPETVTRTFGRISKDIRHTLPVIVLQQKISERSFGAWTMCARQLSQLDNDILNSMEQRGAFPPAYGSGALLLTQLQAIGRVHQAAFDRQAKDVLYL
ncbi:MAG: BLUF domain-containing protein [Phycisphaerales bacterium]|nr:BLUF domain-containing protein [Hyphomonadaceae bacterium]